MLILLTEQNKIINTDFIVRVDEVTNDNDIDDYINLKPDEDIINTTKQLETCCRITMSNGVSIDIDKDISDVWKYINIK